MRLISCHIENFGKLHDCSMEFEPGLNTFCEENGWGKSTFAAFLCVMFYGFDNTTSGNIEKNDRKRYRPWQGGIYGGTILFEAGSRRYRLTRIFGEKEAADSFELRDADTNLLSEDYGRNIGEQLFGINKESFARTAYLAQNHCETAVTDDINASIGRLTEASDDMGSFERALELLTARRNALTPNRATGSVKRRESEILRLVGLLQEEENLPQSLNRAGELCREAEERRAALQEEIAEWTELQTKAAAREALLAKRQEWERLREITADKGQAAEALRRKLPAVLPEKSRLEACLEDCRQLDVIGAKAESSRLSAEEEETLDQLRQQFGDDLPEEKDILYMIHSAHELLRTKNDLTLEQIRKQNELDRLQEQYRLAVKKAQRISPVFYVGVLAAAAGLGLITVNPPVGIAVIVIGALMVFGALIARSKRPLPPPTEEQTQLEYGMAADMRTASDVESELEQAVRYLAGYGIVCDENALIENLHWLKDCSADCRTLAEKQARYHKAWDERNAAEDRIRAFCREFGIETDGEDAEACVIAFQQKMNACRDALTEYRSRQEELRRFEADTDREALKRMEEDNLPGPEEIREKLQRLQEEKDRLQSEILQYHRQAQELRERLDVREEQQEQLEHLRQLQETESTCYQQLTKAQELLTSARESLTARYSQPVLQSFLKYYGSIAAVDESKVFVDANTKVTFSEQGRQRETNTLSAGIRDLIGICLRVSLVDAMYEEERPMLVLDDPFINLDDRKTEAAKAFLRELAAQYQVIYFTCSNYRQ